MSDELRKAAQDALDALKDRVIRIHTASLDGRPKQAYGEMVYAMTQMPEWDTLRAAMQQPDDAKQRLLEIMRKNGLATGHGDTLTQLIDTLEVELTDKRESDARDAARYRWLRENVTPVYMQQNRGSGFDDPRMKWQIKPTLISLTCIMTDITFDAAIDAAMQGDNNGTL